MANDSCAHIEAITTVKPAARHECDECVKIGGRWVHLRTCQQCGTTLCCDNSPNRHATAHSNETGHPVMRSIEPFENWFWCYVDEVAFLADALPDR